MPIKLPQPVAPAPTIAEQAAALALPENSPETITDSNPLLTDRYLDRELPHGLSEKLSVIDQILTDEGRIPIDTLRLACQHVMLCLKQNEDSILALEPEDMQLVVQGYVKAADTKTQETLNPKKKKAAKAKKAPPLPPEEQEW